MYKEPRPQLPWIPLSEALPYGSKIWFSRNLLILLGSDEKRQLKAGCDVDSDPKNAEKSQKHGQVRPCSLTISTS